MQISSYSNNKRTSQLCLLRHLLAGLVSLVLFGGFSCIHAGTPGETLKVITPPLEKSARNHIYYFPELLELALSKTEATDGPFQLEYYPRMHTVSRFLAKLRQGNGVNVMWHMQNDEVDQTLLKIPISLLYGLNSHRVFLIRAEDRDKFAAIKTLDQLKTLKAVSGEEWPDTPILRSHGLPVVTAAHYELLFNMLEGRRADYFPRGLYEIWEEQQIHADKGFVIEDSLMLYYDASIYFYVNPQDKALADRIERGLRIAIQDGSFDELFFSVPAFKRGHDEIANQKRRVFDLSDGQD